MQIAPQTRQNTGQSTNGTKNFEDIVNEYKKYLKLKSAEVSKSKNQFDILVEQYKKSASKDLLNQLYQKVGNVKENKVKNKVISEENKVKNKNILISFCLVLGLSPILL